MAREEISSNTIVLAFVVVILAGLSTGFGAAVVFFPKFVKYATRRVLASALAISAGVMIYVSFVEIFVKSVDSFDELLETKYDDEDKRLGMANLYATLSFFAGVALNCVIDYLVKKLSNENVHDHGFPDQINEPRHHSLRNQEEKDEVVVPHCVGCSPDPVGELQEWQNQAEREVGAIAGVTTLSPEELSNGSSDENGLRSPPGPTEGRNVTPDEMVEAGAGGQIKEVVNEEKEKKRLVKMGLQTALAIGLHNFPEGLATFVAFLDDPSIGIAFAIAIAIHNIPEGFCVSLPVYYATGNRTKAFLWGTFSGVTEPIGAIIGWLFFRNGLDLTLYGIMFGIVGGMMVMISLRELLPTAFRYDPRDTIVTNSLIAGMMVMSLSLVLFRVI